MFALSTDATFVCNKMQKSANILTADRILNFFTTHKSLELTLKESFLKLRRINMPNNAEIIDSRADYGYLLLLI